MQWWAISHMCLVLDVGLVVMKLLCKWEEESVPYPQQIKVVNAKDEPQLVNKPLRTVQTLLFLSC
jgi:hypothetical protein